jgi:hypothetical protein
MAIRPGMPVPGHERADEGQQPPGSRHHQETDSQDVFSRLVTIGAPIEAAADAFSAMLARPEDALLALQQLV